VALVDDHQVEEVGADLCEGVWHLRVVADELLIEAHVDGVSRVDNSLSLTVLLRAYLRHDLLKGLKVLRHRLVDKDIAVGYIENFFLRARLEESPEDLKGREGLARACRHDEEDALLSACDSLYGAVDGDGLIIARLASRLMVSKK
jgi:hypothetical protein